MGVADPDHVGRFQGKRLSSEGELYQRMWGVDPLKERAGEMGFRSMQPGFQLGIKGTTEVRNDKLTRDEVTQQPLFRGMPIGNPTHTGNIFNKKTIRLNRSAGGSIPAYLQAGEFVVRKSAVNAVGTGFLKNVNKMHSGGVVGMQGGCGITAGGNRGGGGMNINTEDLTTLLQGVADAMKGQFDGVAENIISATTKFETASKSWSEGATVTVDSRHSHKIDANMNGLGAMGEMRPHLEDLAVGTAAQEVGNLTTRLGMNRDVDSASSLPMGSRRGTGVA